jgi:hypothetical protein
MSDSIALTLRAQVEKLSEQPIVKQMADQIGVDGMMLLHTIQTMLPKDTNFATLMTCVSVASDLGLNPMTKQIYFMPAKGGQIQPIVSVDGWIAMANRHEDFAGWGEFKPTFKEDADKTLHSMTGIMHHKDREFPTVITEYFDECSKAGPVWKTHPMRMMRNRTLSQLVRVALGISGVMDADEFQQWQASETAEPIELQAVEYAKPRDGGELPGTSKHRPASGAFNQLGGDEKYHALSAAIGKCEAVEDLQACYDGFEQHGIAWASFPLGWARTIQGEYHYRLKDLLEAKDESAPPDSDDDELEDQDGFLSSLKEQIETCPAEHRNEIVEGNADLVARLSPANRLAVAELYADWMS